MNLMSKCAAIVIFCYLAAGCAVTTKKFTEQELTSRIALDRLAMFKDQESLKAPVTIEEAMARAIKYNLDHRLKIMEDALALRQVNLMTFDMLPKLVAAAGYTERDSYNASSSMNVFTNQQSLAPSTSQDLGHYSGDLSLTWNILDFGVSYFQAKQQADRAHIMKERRRKVVHSIMQQVRQEYWLALGAQQLEGRFEPLLKEAEKALKDAHSIEQEKLRPPMETLTYRKTLLEIIKQLEVFRDELAQSKPRLATLMNLPLGQLFTVAPSSLNIPKEPDNIQYLEIRALLQRPELIEADYNERISINETRKTIARMLPGMEMTVGGHFDSTSFLISQKWVEGGARLTWNLINLISGPSQYKLATSQVEIAKAQRLALSIAILTQVHVSYQNFYSRKRQYELSEQLQDVDTRIYEQTMNQARNGSQSQLNEIRAATAALMAEYRSYQNYASLQSACGQIVATIGEDPLPETIASHEIAALSGAIGARLYAPNSLCSPMALTSAPATKSAPIVAVQSVPAAKQPVPSVALSMIPDVITKGQIAKLAWISQYATKCDIQPEIGLMKPQGDADVSPSETTTYTVKCDGAEGTATATATVQVNATPLLEAAKPLLEEASKPKATTTGQCRKLELSLQFETGKSAIKPEHYKEIKMVADFLKEFPGVEVEIAGHTDNKPFEIKNKNNSLSQDRADNVRIYLLKTFGVDPKRITAKGYGKSKPLVDNNTEEGRRQNRRIEVIFGCKKKE